MSDVKLTPEEADKIRPIDGEIRPSVREMLDDWKNNLRAEGALSEREALRENLREVRDILNRTCYSCDEPGGAFEQCTCWEVGNAKNDAIDLINTLLKEAP